MNRGTRSALITLYVLIGVATMIFNVYVRSAVCGSAGCMVSYVKAFAWSIVWPAYWVVHFLGM
jgi:hypothetical protein